MDLLEETIEDAKRNGCPNYAKYLEKYGFEPVVIYMRRTKDCYAAMEANAEKCLKAGKTARELGLLDAKGKIY